MNDEVQLIHRVIARQPEAEEEFVRRYSGLVLGLARGRFALTGEGAEDVLQATMEKLWSDDFRALRAWRGRGRFTSYLTVIVTHLLLRRREADQRRREEAVEPEELVRTADAWPRARPAVDGRPRRLRRSPSATSAPRVTDATRPPYDSHRDAVGPDLAGGSHESCGRLSCRRLPPCSPP